MYTRTVYVSPSRARQMESADYPAPRPAQTVIVPALAKYVAIVASSSCHRRGWREADRYVHSIPTVGMEEAA